MLLAWLFFLCVLMHDGECLDLSVFLVFTVRMGLEHLVSSVILENAMHKKTAGH